ncbi:MAG: putative transcriptional regulator [Francisellaceae bacterium]|jgi:predicted transcriptional regulator
MPEESKINFLTRYAHILLLIHKKKNITIREMALKIGITERTIIMLIGELVIENYIFITRVGRCNVYQININKSLNHNLEKYCNVSQLLEFSCK